MTERDALGLWANIPRLKAGRILDDIRRSGHRISSDAIYDLTLAATGSEAEAERAAREHLKAELRAGQTPL